MSLAVLAYVVTSHEHSSLDFCPGLFVARLCFGFVQDLLAGLCLRVALRMCADSSILIHKKSIFKVNYWLSGDTDWF